ncbi:uncharacterized protein LOC123537188 [Mercenaria mercenaria]|uniref:uncharacterized protein LOC123537188 n=1 Tax=Mercenaria mercenaria TaxID=6596 RepID=UPI00234F348B|nr:uncharacterized protein LOC123537188 [Mercenaria mercenaria]
MERIRMLFEQNQHLVSGFLDNFYQETDLFGTASSNDAIKILQTQIVSLIGENSGEVSQAAFENNASSSQRCQGKAIDKGENSADMSKAAVEDNVSSPQRHQSKAIDEDENSGEVPQAAVEDNASFQRHQSKSVDEDENSTGVLEAAVEDNATSSQRYQSKSIDKEPTTSRIRILFERLRHLLSGFLVYRRRKSTDVSKMPENATIVQAERATVQLFSSHIGNTIKDIEVHFIELLMKKLKNANFVKCNELKDIDWKKMLIVLCIISSRVATDAAYAINDIKNPANTVLMLIHNKESHALPKLTSSFVLTDQEFQNLGGVFDLAFFERRGIYQCEMNDIALDKVCTFIKKNWGDTN